MDRLERPDKRDQEPGEYLIHVLFCTYYHPDLQLKPVNGSGDGQRDDTGDPLDRLQFYRDHWPGKVFPCGDAERLYGESADGPDHERGCLSAETAGEFPLC